jgi:hypothetical protein
VLSMVGWHWCDGMRDILLQGVLGQSKELVVFVSCLKLMA